MAGERLNLLPPGNIGNKFKKKLFADQSQIF